MNKWRKKKPYGCSRCIKDFDKESQLKRHLKDKHGVDLKPSKQITKELSSDIN